MLLRLAYLAATNTFALLRLLPMSDRDKDIEIRSAEPFMSTDVPLDQAG